MSGDKRTQDRRGPEAAAVASVVEERNHGAAGDDVRQRVHSVVGSGGRIRGPPLGVPVAVEVIPVLRMRADPRGQLIGELLRRGRDRLVARPIACDDDRRRRSGPGTGRAPMRSMKQGTSGAPVMNPISGGVRRNHAAPAEQLHLHAVAPEMAIHQHRDDAVLRRAAGGSAAPCRATCRLRSCRRRAARESPAAAGSPPGSASAMADDRQRQVAAIAAHEHAADFPVAVVAGDEDDAAALRQQSSNSCASSGR